MTGSWKATKVDWDQTYYLGVTLEFDYKQPTCRMLMPEYVKQALIKFHHEFSKTTHSPSPFKVLVYGQKIQMTTIDKTNPMTTVHYHTFYTPNLQSFAATHLHLEINKSCKIEHPFLCSYKLDTKP